MPKLRASLPVLLASLALLTTRGAEAQATRPICTLRALRTGRLIRVRDTTPVSVVGPFESCSDSLLTLGRYRGQTDSGYAVRTALIRRMWAHDNQARIGLIAGAVAGAVVGGAFAAAKSDICFKGSPPAPARCHGNIVINAVVFGGGGGLVGLMLGHGFPRWAKIFP
jgi:hypothetical protein